MLTINNVQVRIVSESDRVIVCESVDYVGYDCNGEGFKEKFVISKKHNKGSLKLNGVAIS